MKVKCINCKTDLNKVITKNFDEYLVGRYECSKCRNKQKRYISELDLMIYFGLSCLSYALSIFIVFTLFNIINDIMISSIIVAIFFIGLFFLFRIIPLWIYDKTPLKYEWKEYKFSEEEKQISKRMKWQFIMFLIVSFMFGTSNEFTIFFIILIVAFIIITFIKIYLLYKREKQTVLQNKGLAK